MNTQSLYITSPSWGIGADAVIGEKKKIDGENYIRIYVTG